MLTDLLDSLVVGMSKELFTSAHRTQQRVSQVLSKPLDIAINADVRYKQRGLAIITQEPHDHGQPEPFINTSDN